MRSRSHPSGPALDNNQAGRTARMHRPATFKEITVEYIERYPPTDAQLRILRILALERASRKIPPTIKQVADIYGCTVAGVLCFLRALEWKGLAENPGNARGWRPTRLGWETVEDWLGDQGVVLGERGMTVYQRVDVTA